MTGERVCGSCGETLDVSRFGQTLYRCGCGASENDGKQE